MSQFNFDELLKSNNVKEDDECVSDLVNDYNLSYYNYKGAKIHPSANLLICTCCKRDVSVDDSFSDQGQFLHCILCAEQAAKRVGQSTIRWLERNVWLRGVI